MRRLMVLVLVAGCTSSESGRPGGARERSSALEARDEGSVLAPRLALTRALSILDPEPDCAELEGLTPDPVGDLLSVVDTVEEPPWVPLRAAACLSRRHAPAVRSDLVSWVSERETRGLAMVAIDSLPHMPAEVALQVVTAAAAGPFSATVEERLATSDDPSLRALVGR